MIIVIAHWHCWVSYSHHNVHWVSRYCHRRAQTSDLLAIEKLFVLQFRYTQNILTGCQCVLSAGPTIVGLSQWRGLEGRYFDHFTNTVNLATLRIQPQFSPILKSQWAFRRTERFIVQDPLLSSLENLSKCQAGSRRICTYNPTTCIGMKNTNQRASMMDLVRLDCGNAWSISLRRGSYQL